MSRHLSLAKENRFCESRVKEYTIQLIIGLKDLHEEGIVYGDMNPKFISMDEYGFLCMSDYCCDKEIHRKKKDKNSIHGSICYLAPENIFHKLKFEGMTGKEGDWYGLGVLMYFLVVVV